MTTTTTETFRIEGKTADEWRDMARACRQRAADSWARSDTDGFLSQWASDTCAREYDAKAELADQQGLAEFPALFDLEGNLVAAKLVEVDNRYRPGWKISKWIVLEDDNPRSRAMQWIAAFPARRSTMARKGFVEGWVKAPAKVIMVGSSTSVGPAAVRTDGGFSREVEIVGREWKYEKA